MIGQTSKHCSLELYKRITTKKTGKVANKRQCSLG